MPVPLPPDVPLTTKPPKPPITSDRAIMHISGTLMGYIALLMVPTGLVAVAAGTDRLYWDEPPWQGPYLIAYGFYSVIAGSVGLNAGINMVRSRYLTFCCVGVVMVLAAGVASLLFDEQLLAFWGIYILFLAVPATVGLAAANNAFHDGAEAPPMGEWTAPPGPPPTWFTGPSPPPVQPVQADPARGGTLHFVPPATPPPAFLPPYPPYPYPNPPRLLWIKDVGRARAAGAGILSTVTASVLAYFGLSVIIWPANFPGFFLGVLALVATAFGIAGGYLALLRIRKGLAIGLALYMAVIMLGMTVEGFVMAGAFGILYLPFLVLGLAVLWATWRAYAPVRMPFPMPPPMPVAPTPPHAR